jgi:hypothetical protein
LKSLSLSLAIASILTAAALAQMRVVTLPGKSRMVDFRVVFEAGSAADPPQEPGTAWLTAMMLGHGGSKQMTGGRQDRGEVSARPPAGRRDSRAGRGSI